MGGLARCLDKRRMDMHRRLFVFIILILSAVCALSAQDRTVINSAKAKQMLLGRHKLSLQWISWDYFGSAIVTDERCHSVDTGEEMPGRCFWLKGSQNGRGTSDFLKINGLIKIIEERQFEFEGEIQIQVSHINGGKPCTRLGNFIFKITGKRKYWRMQEIDNPCDEAADYVDVYFR